MVDSMGARGKLISDQDVLVAIEATIGSLHIYDDGRANFCFEGRSMTLGREIGRYALRRLYLGHWGACERAAIQELALALERCSRCQRSDCAALIPEERRRKAFDRDTPAKWCSVRCQRTEATRRYLARRKR